MRWLVEGLRRRGVECGVESPLWREPIERWDLIHCHDARSHTFARKPFVVSRRVAFPVGRDWLSRWKYARAEAYLAVSNFVAEELRAAGVPSGRIHVVPDGVPARPLADRSGGRVLSLSKSGVAVPGTQAVADIERDLAHCDVFVYWSDMEGLGSAALLAQAAGVPVVARRVGGLPEAVRHGVLIDRLEELPGAIAAAREIAVDVPAFLATFGLDAMTDRTLAVYRKVLHG